MIDDCGLRVEGVSERDCGLACVCVCVCVSDVSLWVGG